MADLERVQNRSAAPESITSAVAQIAVPSKDVRFEEKTETEWILDTGTGNQMSPSDQHDKKNFGKPLLLETASGLINTTTRTTVSFDTLAENYDGIAKIVLRALSIGRRCCEHGWEVSWEPWAGKPTRIGPDGERVEVRCDKCVPSIVSANGDAQIRSENDWRNSLCGRRQHEHKIQGTVTRLKILLRHALWSRQTKRKPRRLKKKTCQGTRMTAVRT